jgi:ribosomal protein S18 acetylase RimI-like enzyme
VICRDATAADVDAIVALVESAYRGDASRAGWTTEADLLDGQRTDAEAVRSIIAAAGSRMLLAIDDAGDLLACCQLERRDEAAYFGMFSVRPGQQGGGLGRAMLAEAERLARAEWGVGVMRMQVIKQRRDLIAWYERRGYVATGERHPFPYGDERYGKPRRDDLEFQVLEKPLAS